MTSIVTRLVAVAMLVSWTVVCTSLVAESRDPSEPISFYETESSKPISNLMTLEQTAAKTRNRRDTDTGLEVDQPDEEDENETIVAVPDLKRFASFRSDLGKRRPFRSDLGRKRSVDYDVIKRFAAFRSDLGKRRTAASSSSPSLNGGDGIIVDRKRYASFRSDLGKRSNDFEINDDEDDDDVEFDTEKRYAAFRSDLGKRRHDDADDDKPMTSLDDGLIVDNDEKRFASFRSDLGKRRLRQQQPGQLAETKKATSYFRSDLGKRSMAFRTDLGKRNAGDEPITD